LSSEAERKALYERAKAALDAQFSSMDQSLAAELIRTHTQNFDEAVARIEREQSAASAAQSAPGVLPGKESTESVPSQAADPVATEPDKGAAPPAQPQTAAALPATAVAESAKPAAQSPESSPAAAKETPSSAAQPNAPGAAPAVPLKPSTPPQGDIVPEPEKGPGTGIGAATGGAENRPGTQPGGKSGPDGPIRAMPGEGPPPEPKRRGVTATILAVLFILIAGTSAFSLWQRDLVSGYTDRLGEITGLWNGSVTPMEPDATPSEEMEPESNAAPENPSTDNSATTADDPLASDESESSSTQSLPADSNPAAVNSRVGESAPVTAQPAEQPEQQEVAANQPADTAANGEDATATGDDATAAATSAAADESGGANDATGSAEPPGEDTPGETQLAANEETDQPTSDAGNDEPQTNTSPIELPLRAFFLMEKSNGGSGPDERYNGGAKWQFDAASNTLRIETFYGGTNSELNIEIKPNTDDSLPATHTVTYEYTPLGEAPDGPIVNFPALMLREDAGSQGKPLKGAGALIVPNKYLLGLSDKAEDLAHNLELMEKGQWVVVPAIFETGNRRALFVIEKGPAGTRAMEAAFTAWDQSPGDH